MNSLTEAEQYVFDVASGNPTPGGGSVAGLVSSLGAALAAMTTNFTLGKKKYLEHDTKSREILQKLNQYIQASLDLAQKDIAAYENVRLAFSMPKTSDEEVLKRKTAISNNCEKALKAPFEVISIAKKSIDLIEQLSVYSNPNLDSDTMGAALLLKASADVAFYCVHANLPFLESQEKIKLINSQMVEKRLEIDKQVQNITKVIENRMGISNLKEERTDG